MVSLALILSADGRGLYVKSFTDHHCILKYIVPIYNNKSCLWYLFYVNLTDHDYHDKLLFGSLSNHDNNANKNVNKSQIRYEEQELCTLCVYIFNF